MSSVKVCIGCGIKLQGNLPNEEGYLPNEKLESGHNLYCQRCFKIKNYGKYIPVIKNEEDYRKEVNSALKESQVAVVVFDLIDFEGSFNDEILDIMREIDTIVVINKVDLIPNGKHPSKVADWVKKRLKAEGISPLDIAIVSSKNGYGISGIYKKINHFYPNGVKAIVLGVTNAGKSSIINKLIGKKRITESKYPGTTLKSVKNKIPYTNIEIIDTPGLIPKGRISDLVCEECNLKIVPSTEITRKIYKIRNGRIILIEKMLWIKILNKDEVKPIFSLYLSKSLTIHETNCVKGIQMFSNKDDNNVFKVPCNKCEDRYNGLKFKKIRKTINPGEDLVFKGLGWLSVKRGPLEIEIYLPEEAQLIQREAFLADIV
ncbi:MAG: ribosome biogenesis GTPase YqeH [Fusobacteriaceae bacterium]|jgi:ribosome biogenesis GTPase YqeH|nr:ribosome biogenesis GTPase YqeH [Fusobacteriaceae bacterium]